MLSGVREGATAGSLDGWCWRELKVLPVFWFDELPKTDGDATPLGQRPLSVLPIVYRV